MHWPEPATDPHTPFGISSCQAPSGYVHLCEIRGVFEGAERIQDWVPPDWWWLGWCLVAMAVACFRQWSPRYFVHLRWAWTDYRLLIQSRGDFTAPWYSGWLQNAVVGAALSLGLVGMAARLGWAPLSPEIVLGAAALWGGLMLTRWLVARIWEWVSHGEIPGREWALGHRYVVEATAWVLAPIGLGMTLCGPQACEFGVWILASAWGVGWLVRQRRTFQRIRRLMHNPVEGFFYLCGLEILPVAVLIRAWQG